MLLSTIDFWSYVCRISKSWFFTLCRNHYNLILEHVIIEFDNLTLKIVQIFMGTIWLPPITALRVHKITMFKSIRCNLLETSITLYGVWWYGILRVNWTVINWSHRIYNGEVRKMTSNNPNYFGISCVSIRQFCIGFCWDEDLKVLQKIVNPKIYSSVFMKQHIWNCIKPWRSSYQYLSLGNMKVYI